VAESIGPALRLFIQETFLFGRELNFSNTDSFLDQGIIDSTGVLELITFLESTYGIHVEDRELVPENLDSVDNVVRFVESKLNQSAEAA
jgi:acyl carrier protein